MQWQYPSIYEDESGNRYQRACMGRPLWGPGCTAQDSASRQRSHSRSSAVI